MRLLALLIIAAAACVSLAGCGSKLRATSAQAIAEAEKIENPSVAWGRIKAAKDELYLLCAEGDTFRSLCDAPIADLITAEGVYIQAAAANGDAAAVRVLYERGDLEAAQNRLAPAILKAAKETTDPNILFAAAKIFGDGNSVPRNTRQQAAYLAQAWRLGDMESVGALAVALEAFGDYPNAYLWSLRCTNGCQRRATVQLRYLERGLSRDQILSIQQMALDTSHTDVGPTMKRTERR